MSSSVTLIEESSGVGVTSYMQPADQNWRKAEIGIHSGHAIGERNRGTLSGPRGRHSGHALGRKHPEHSPVTKQPKKTRISTKIHPPGAPCCGAPWWGPGTCGMWKYAPECVLRVCPEYMPRVCPEGPRVCAPSACVDCIHGRSAGPDGVPHVVPRFRHAGPKRHARRVLLRGVRALAAERALRRHDVLPRVGLRRRRQGAGGEGAMRAALEEEIDGGARDGLGEGKGAPVHVPADAHDVGADAVVRDAMPGPPPNLVCLRTPPPSGTFSPGSPPHALECAGKLALPTQQALRSHPARRQPDQDAQGGGAAPTLGKAPAPKRPLHLRGPPKPRTSNIPTPPPMSR